MLSLQTEQASLQTLGPQTSHLLSFPSRDDISNLKKTSIKQTREAETLPKAYLARLEEAVLLRKSCSFMDRRTMLNNMLFIGTGTAKL